LGEGARLGYYIEVEEIQPLGRYNYAAKAILSKRVDASKFPTQPPLGEEWGVTEDEAEAKVRKGMEEWGKKAGVSVTEV